MLRKCARPRFRGQSNVPGRGRCVAGTGGFASRVDYRRHPRERASPDVYSAPRRRRRSPVRCQRRGNYSQRAEAGRGHRGLQAPTPPEKRKSSEVRPKSALSRTVGVCTGLLTRCSRGMGGGWGRSDGKNKLMTNVHRREDMGRERHFAKSGWWFLEKAQVRTWPSRSHFLGIAASPLVLTNLLLLNLISPVSGGVGKGDIKDMGGAPGSKMRDWASLVKHPYGHGPYTRCPLAPLSTSSLSLESPCN